MPTPEAYQRRLSELRQAIEGSREQQQAALGALDRAAVSAGKINQSAVAFNVFKRLLASNDLRGALHSVLRKSDYRFVGIFRFKNGLATAAVHVDREDLSATRSAEVPDTATYCSYVRESRQPFATEDAMLDQRTVGHAARDVVRSYCGLPLYEPDGTLIGTLCFYDLVPRAPDQLDPDLLLQVCLEIADSGQVPPYPDWIA